MPSPRNTFSAHILNSVEEETEAPQGQPAVKPVAPVRSEKPEPKASEASVHGVSEESKGRPDYRKTRASKEGKKYINILIDKDLQFELKPRMATRELTWESLVEGLLRRWLEENPGFKP